MGGGAPPGGASGVQVSGWNVASGRWAASEVYQEGRPCVLGTPQVGDGIDLSPEARART